MNSIYKATLETRNFSFEAVGYDERHAKQSLIDGLNNHRRQYNLAFDWYSLDEICIQELKIGVTYRDGSEIKTPLLYDAEIEQLAEIAINIAVKHIQKDLGIEFSSGDLAGNYFSDDITKEIFCDYIKQELINLEA